MQLFYEYKQLKQAQNLLIKLAEQRAKGELELKSFYERKKELECTIALYKNITKPTLQIHQNYTLSYLLEFTFHELEVDKLNNACINNLRLFTQQDRSMLTGDTIIILDGYDNDDDEGYTQYVINNNLELAYNGELFVDVVSSYKDYKTEFNTDLLIKALEYYSEYDNFLEFE